MSVPIKYALVTEEHEVSLRVKSERVSLNVSGGANKASTSRKKSLEDAINLGDSEYDADTEEDPVFPNLALASAEKQVDEGYNNDQGEPAPADVPDTPNGSQENQEQ